MAIELRCEHRLHAVLTDFGQIEVKCRSALCGKEGGIVILHYYSITTGELMKTRRYRDTPSNPKGNDNGSRR